MLNASAFVIFVGLKFMVSHVQSNFKGCLCITEVSKQHYFHIQWRRVLSTVSMAKPLYERLKTTFVVSLVQLTGLVGPKICDVHVIALSHVSETFWKCGSTESLMIPKNVIFFQKYIHI